MKLIHVVALSVLLCLVAVAISPAALAAPEISATVDGEDVSDGGTVEVEEPPAAVSLNITSNVGVDRVQTEYGGTLDIEGLNARQVYRSNFNVSVFGQKSVSIQATDTSNETQRFSFTLTPSSSTPTGVRETMENLEERANRLENETSRLEERRQELRQRRQELRQQLNNMSGSGNAGTDNGSGSGNGSGNGDGIPDGAGSGGGQGLPGFTAVAALVAVAISVAAVSLRKRS